ncbi:7-deoxyloganetin glucosyltransferase-like isoform X2 [Actinidia eriantha]|uniref:7-deoxyloganetin glucosyltransferase-like isoform X2 n=1 Tax=Actinidia eriantha TaxID=165200 RepID=UPI00258E41C8|nr:7-deoxyloganetin glucosyltransferase-like isoform X2 [Actinidia eriantha]
MSSMAQTGKPSPHAVCIPYPAQGHITPMLKLAKLLHHRGFQITVVNTEFNHRRLLKSQGASSLHSVSSFRFETIPDGLPPSDADATQDIPSLCDSVRKNFLVPFRDLLTKLTSTVTCIVSDVTMNVFTVKVAEELCIPVVLLWTSSTSAFMGFVHYRQLIQKGMTPLRDEICLSNGYLDTVIDWIPGMKGIRLKDLPTFIRTTDPNDIMVAYALEVVDISHKASAMVFNTFDALEHDVLEALSTMFPPIYALGPLQLLLNQIPENDLDSIRSSLWKEEAECLTWLDSKESNSVVYVNFGSITVMTPQQMTEFAWGLANSKQAFLWIIRPDLVAGDSAILPGEFVTETKGRGLLATWCPQEEVLNHPSIGGFLTHCGWNSTLESISSGVPVLCWPFFAEQTTNCWYCCNHWGVGMEIESDVKREKVESLVRELVVGERGREMKRRAMEWKSKAEEATACPVGSSYVGFEMVVQCLLKSNIVD